MENFAQDRLAICISGNELPLPNPMTLFVQEGASSTDLGEIPPSLPLPYPFFTLSKILKATNNFDDALVVGTGGFGKVYKAIIDDGTVVAIKRLNTESNQGAEEFWTEVKLLSTLRHTHLVSLIGYCNEHQEMILVYEYMAHGTLASHLYKSSRDESGGSVSPLTWVQRLNICLGAARGLNYLHIGTKQSIIHRDVKTTNILLDENWVAKVSDFGICKLITSQTTTHVSTKVKATRGYWDPDYFYTNRVTRKSDVYAFGVVLLEVLCGRPPLDHRLEEEQISLVLWAKDHIKNGKLDRIIDPSLNGETTQQSLKYFSKIADKCLHTKPKERPTMSEVVELLQELLQNALALHERKGRSWGTITKAFQGIKLVPMGMTRRWREGNGNSSNNGGGLPKQSVPQPIFDDVTHSVDPRFSLAEIHAATNNFNESLMNEYSNIDVFTYKEMRLAIEHSDEVYEDGGVVYKGVIDESVRPGYKTTNVTIEKLRPEWVFQGENVLLVDELDKKLKEEGVYSKLKAEVSYLGQLSHPNLVKLIGYCCEDEDLLLVYEYMASGSLEKHLFKRDCFTLTWPIRMKIALDAARALAFLHHAKRPIIYRDFKTSCILLDADFNAKLSYFGLAVDRPMGPWALMGSYGYAAPEYIATGQLTTRSDVYGFGVVLLEMLVGRKAMDMSRPSPEQNLVEWARPFLIHDEKLLRILDPRVEGQYSTRTALKVAHLAYQCLSETRKERPVMNQVVEILETLQTHKKKGKTV